MKLSVVVALFGFFFHHVFGDMYVLSPLFSNNRLDERDRDRDNGNRLFDSQNNDRGGFNVGKMSYYVGEQVPIAWSNQHSAGLYQLKGTEIIFQYTCDPLARDGVTTSTIPQSPSECANFDCDTDIEFGRHESWSWYQYCKATSRNKGLFTANQNLQGSSARFTRQNPGGTIRGYECPEERDYYPYWRATMWRDIAIFTNQEATRCASYKAESENVKAREQCVFTEEYWNDVLMGYYPSKNKASLPITKEQCEGPDRLTYTSPRDNKTKNGSEWTTIGPWGIGEPECLPTKTTRANHHGIYGRSFWSFIWSVPNPIAGAGTGRVDGVVDEWEDASCCVLRARYNITTDDYPAWLNDMSLTPGLNSSFNSARNNPNPNNDPANYSIWENFGLTFEDIEVHFRERNNPDGTQQKKGRGYVFRNNPRVDPFGINFTIGNDATNKFPIQLQLAINTNQFGRVFQDRSHCFQILPTPDEISVASTRNLKLLTVQGKRGNIVQVYPATEYFFVPEPIQVAAGDWIHFCWTGSNTNPENNDGQGRRGTDRANICPLTKPQFVKGNTATTYGEVDGNTNNLANTFGDLQNSYPDYVREPVYGLPEYYDFANKRGVTGRRMADLDERTLIALCTGRRSDFYKDALEDSTRQGILDYGNMEELDDAGTTFCMPPVQAGGPESKFNFLCTRNNNFSNRSHKGTLLLQEAEGKTKTISETGGVIRGGTGEARLLIQAGMIQSGATADFTLITWENVGEESTIVQITGVDGAEFDNDALANGAWFELWIPYTPRSLNKPVVFHRASEDDKWKEKGEASIEYSDDTYFAVIGVTEGGFYRAANVPNWATIIAFIVGAGAFIAMLLVVFAKKCKAV